MQETQIAKKRLQNLKKNVSLEQDILNVKYFLGCFWLVIHAV